MAHLDPGAYERSHRLARAKYARGRRKRLREAKLCLTASKHGPATHGVLCADCRRKHG